MTLLAGQADLADLFGGRSKLASSTVTLAPAKRALQQLGQLVRELRRLQNGRMGRQRQRQRSDWPSTATSRTWPVSATMRPVSGS